jgi:hypothetical protein
LYAASIAVASLHGIKSNVRETPFDAVTVVVAPSPGA